MSIIGNIFFLTGLNTPITYHSTQFHSQFENFRKKIDCVIEIYVNKIIFERTLDLCF